MISNPDHEMGITNEKHLEGGLKHG